MTNKVKYSLESIDFNTQFMGSGRGLVLLHGYGANAHDLAPLAPIMSKDDEWARVPEAPERPPELAAFGGRAWYGLDMQLLQMRNSDPSGPLLDKAHIERMQSCVDEKLLPWLESMDLPEKSLTLAGFSQGSMIGLDLLLRHRPNFLSSIVFFSGAWPYPKDALPELHPQLKERGPLPVFVSHGTQDPVLPVRHSRRMVDELRKLGFQVEQNEFPGAHEIPQEILAKVQQFLGLKS